MDEPPFLTSEVLPVDISNTFIFTFCHFNNYFRSTYQIQGTELNTWDIVINETSPWSLVCSKKQLQSRVQMLTQSVRVLWEGTGVSLVGWKKQMVWGVYQYGRNMEGCQG